MPLAAASRASTRVDALAPRVARRASRRASRFRASVARVRPMRARRRVLARRARPTVVVALGRARDAPTTRTRADDGSALTTRPARPRPRRRATTRARHARRRRRRRRARARWTRSPRRSARSTPSGRSGYASGARQRDASPRSSTRTTTSRSRACDARRCGATRRRGGGRARWRDDARGCDEGAANARASDRDDGDDGKVATDAGFAPSLDVGATRRGRRQAAGARCTTRAHYGALACCARAVADVPKRALGRRPRDRARPRRARRDQRKVDARSGEETRGSGSGRRRDARTTFVRSFGSGGELLPGHRAHGDRAQARARGGRAR